MSRSKQEQPIPDVKKMYMLAEQYYKASEILKEQITDKPWGSSAPRLLVEFFSIELYLKCLFVLDTNKSPIKGHNIKSLFGKLETHTKNAIRSTFNQTISSNFVLSNIDLFNPDAAKTLDFDRLLTVSKDTFDKRRYLYEELPSGEWFYSYLLRDAIRTVTKMDIRLHITNNNS